MLTRVTWFVVDVSLHTPGLMHKSSPRSKRGLESVDALVEEVSCSQVNPGKMAVANREIISATNTAIREQGSWEDLLLRFSNSSKGASSSSLNVALYKAVTHRCVKGVRALLSDRRTDPSKNHYKVLRDCIQTGFAKGLVLLLSDDRVDPRDTEFCPFEVAVENHQVEVVKILLEDGRRDPGSKQNYAIRLAALLGNAEIVELLLQSDKVDPGDMDNEAIRVASKCGNTGVVKALLHSPKVNPSAKESEALRCAATEGHIGVVRELLMDHKVDPTAMNYEALRNAHESKRDNVVEAILLDRRVRGTVEDSVARSQFVNDSQREKLKQLKRVREALASDVDRDFEKRYKSHLLRVAIVGAVQELSAHSPRRHSVGLGACSGEQGNRFEEQVDDRNLQRVFRKNVERFLPHRLQGLLRGVTPSFELYKKLFAKYKRSERLQFLFEWHFNFEGTVDSDLLENGFRPCALRIDEVKSFPEMFMYAKNTHMEFVGKLLGKIFAVRTCASTKSSLSHAECIALFRMIMYIYSTGSNQFVYKKEMYQQVAKLVARAIRYKAVSKEDSLVARLELLEAKSFKPDIWRSFEGTT